MKAITYDRYGPPDVLRLEHVDKPTVAADEMLIKVYAVEATKADCEMRSFQFSVKWFWLPLRIAFGLFKPRRRILGSYRLPQKDSWNCKITEGVQVTENI